MRVRLADIPGAALLNQIVQPLWDTILVGTSQVAPLTFFTVPQGGTKTLVDSNMVQGGALPKPDEFYLRSFLIQPLPRSPLNAVFALTDVTDASRLLDQGIFEFFVGTAGRRLVQGHLQLFPCGLGLQGMVTAGGGATVSYMFGNGIRDVRNHYGLPPQYAEKLNANESFKATVTFPAGTLSMSNSISLRVYLGGILGQSIG
jgi:hypothetical protein